MHPAADTCKPASRSTLFALSFGHGSVDVCSGALFALLPFLVAQRHYSYAAAGVFALTFSVANALLQPLIGAQGDRREAHWLLPAGLAVAGLGLGAVGFTTRYPVTLGAVALCSAGIATYHPEGARWARRACGARVTADMSVFSVGGGVGYAIGPLIVAAALAPVGLHGTVVMALIPLTAAVVVLVALRRFGQTPAATQRPHEHARSLDSEWRPFALLVGLCAVGSGVSTGLITYVPLFVLQSTSATASTVLLSVMFAAAAGGTLLGGMAAQRFGRRFVLLVPQLALVPAIAVLPSLGYAATIPVAALLGIAMNFTMSTTLVLAQEYLPARMGLASGLTIGLCGGAGGLIVAALGLLGDARGPSAVLYVLAALPVMAALLAWRLPRPAAAPPGTLWGLRAEA
jgi:MFS transporter, FSR family, fosmidomycin resistance protein